MSHRLLCFALLEFTSPVHVGSGRLDDPYADQPVLRDSRGVPFLPGNSLVGTLAASLTDNPDLLKWLRPVDSQGALPSPLVMDDAYPLPGQQQWLHWPVDLRSQVSLLRDSLTAKPDHHFSLETTPRSTTFCFSCRADFRKDTQMGDFCQHLQVFLASGAVGGKQNTGLGNWRCEKLFYTCLNLSDLSDLRQWLETWHGFQFTGQDWGTGQDITEVETTPVPADDWIMTLPVAISGLHLSAGGSGLPQKNRPDLEQAQRSVFTPTGELAAEYVDYGSTVKGRLRTAMEMLLRTYLVQFGKQDAGKVLTYVSPNPSPSSPAGQSKWQIVRDFFGHQMKKGGWRVAETAWQGEVQVSDGEDHIRLDEFTQQVIMGAKFAFAPLNKGHAAVEVSLPRTAPDWQKELLYYAGKLLAANLLPWGGHGSRGYLGARLGPPQVSGDIPQGKLKTELQTFLESVQEKKS